MKAEPAPQKRTLNGEDGRFVPGNNGNPGGRPKGLAKRVRELVGNDGETLAEFMLEILNNPAEKTKERMDAATWLADRGWGKAAQHAPIDDGDPLDLDDVDRVIEQAVDELAERRQTTVVSKTANGTVGGTSTNGTTPPDR